MKYREFVTRFDKIEDNVYEGYVINSSFGGRFYFSDRHAFTSFTSFNTSFSCSGEAV